MTKERESKRNRPPTEAHGFEIEQSPPEEVASGLDPHLQEVILQVRDGSKVDASFSQTAPDGDVLVDVIAKLDDVGIEVAGLKVVCKIGKIVTGQVAVGDIEQVRANDNVTSLKRATRLLPELEFSVGEMNATRQILESSVPTGTSPPTGDGVIVGIVDYGADFQHNNFRNPDGSTRILFLWDQTGGESTLSPQPYNYGREFDADAINAALNSGTPYQALAYDPGSSAHGTHVMDIAAGNGRATGNPGVAPNADLIFVNVAHDDIDLIESPTDGDLSNFGNSKMLLEAVDYIFRRAAERGQQAVINLSLGTHGGPHDGSTLAEEGFDTLLSESGRAITISAGNSRDNRSHASGTVSSNAPRTLQWLVHDQDDTPNELEIWYDGDAELAVALETPAGQLLSPVSLGTTVSLSANGEIVGRVIHRATDPNNEDNHVDIVLGASLPGGEWKVHVSGTTANETHFHAWIERDFPSFLNPFRQSSFDASDDDPTFTLGSISCGQHTIAVGSYLSGLPDREVSPFTAEGPTRDNRQKPEVSAPGQFLHPFGTQGILAAKSRTQGATRMSGTSMASPHVAGMIALMMQSAGRRLAIEDVRRALLATARKNPPDGNGWDARYGFGRVDARAAVENVRQVDVPMRLTSPAARVSAGDNTHDALDQLLATVASAATGSSSRVRIQIEIDPAL